MARKAVGWKIAADALRDARHALRPDYYLSAAQYAQREKEYRARHRVRTRDYFKRYYVTVLRPRRLGLKPVTRFAKARGYQPPEGPAPAFTGQMVAVHRLHYGRGANCYVGRRVDFVTQVVGCEWDGGSWRIVVRRPAGESAAVDGWWLAVGNEEYAHWCFPEKKEEERNGTQG